MRIIPIILLLVIAYHSICVAQENLQIENKQGSIKLPELEIIKLRSELDYMDNDETYLVYQAYLDTLIIGEQPFTIAYDTGQLLINYKTVPEPYNTEYVLKIKAMLSRQKIPEKLQTFTIRAKKFDTPPIELIDKGRKAKDYNKMQNGSYFNSISGFLDLRNQCKYKTGGMITTRVYDPRNYNPFFSKIAATDSILMTSLLMDGFVNDNVKSISVRCNSQVCTIDDVPIRKGWQAKYLEMVLNIVHKVPETKNDYVRVTYDKRKFESLSLYETFRN